MSLLLVPDSSAIQVFHSIVRDYYHQHPRNFCWRQDTSPYMIFLSEIMLQQTQTARVEKLLPTFIAKYPDLKALAAAGLADVLLAWQGLGYNSRAMRLHQAAQILVQKFDGILPADPELLQSLPGIGPNSAGSMVVYAFNLPVAFIETNIRTVYIHHFFSSASHKVSDKELLPVVNATLDRTNPRLWYWALMDYGVYLKRLVGNVSRKAKSYTVQSAFVGSKRQTRGAIIRLLSQEPAFSCPKSRLLTRIPASGREHFEAALLALQQEGLVVCDQELVYLPN